MKISREWLQKYFETPLPEAQKLADALTFHAFEIESVDGDILDVKVTANRGHDCLSHRGIAKETSAILNIPLKRDPFRETVSLEPKTEAVQVNIEDGNLCPRFTGAVIKRVKVGPSPAWLKEKLEVIGQKSINNVVDATNYVMFDIGQPLHAFDTGKLKQDKGSISLSIRLAKEGEKLMGLDDKEYELTSSMLVIEDSNAGAVASIAGIKGGKPTGIDETTTDIFLEAANWNGVCIRKTSQALKLRTDASDRFQQVISSELAPYGTHIAAKLIVELAGGEIAGYVDEYPGPAKLMPVVVSTAFINKVLGTKLSAAEVEDVFSRLGFSYEKKGSEYMVQPPYERIDIVIPEDLVEEVGRIVGYDKVSSLELPPFPKKPEVNANFYAAEKAREELVAQGYSEVYTSVFAEKGERAVANKVGGEKPYLRVTLTDGLAEAHERNTRNSDLLGLKGVKLFEIGTVWKGGKEKIMIATADSKGVQEKELLAANADTYEDLPTSTTERYKPFSRFPSIARDIAMWVPANTNPDDVLSLLQNSAGELLVRIELFDRFEKGEKLSLAFRLVFQSFEKTLTDQEANAAMEAVYTAVKKQGWEVR